MSRVLLLGAGASYGATGVLPHSPPLGAGLFDELRKAYPNAWGTIPESDRPKFVPNFELGMKELWDSNSHATPVLMRCIADYFARFRSDGSGTYERLLQGLEDEGALGDTFFSTLNYECVLETAARNHGFSRVEFFREAPTDDEALTVWKIHGSCNFLPASVAGGAGAVSFSGAAVKWDGEMKIVDPSQVGPFVANSAFYPAMAVFMEGKPVHSHQSAIATTQSWWAKAVSEAECVGVIGVHPNVADEHLWAPLADADGKLVILGDVDASEQWAASYRNGRETQVVGDRFDRDLAQFVEDFSS